MAVSRRQADKGGVIRIAPGLIGGEGPDDKVCDAEGVAVDPRWRLRGEL